MDNIQNDGFVEALNGLACAFGGVATSLNRLESALKKQGNWKKATTRRINY